MIVCKPTRRLGISDSKVVGLLSLTYATEVKDVSYRQECFEKVLCFSKGPPCKSKADDKETSLAADGGSCHDDMEEEGYFSAGSDTVPDGGVDYDDIGDDVAF